MGLQQFWFVLVAAMFLGFFVLEGLDFGVGMLMEWLGRRGAATAEGGVESHRRAVLNTIGPVWDGNEVWLITAAGAMFAAFPLNWYATVFSGLYLPLLAILLSMIARVVAIEWRGKIDDPKWRTWCDAGIGGRLLVTRHLVGRRLRGTGQGPAGGSGQERGRTVDHRRSQPLHPAGRVATCALFLFHGAVFLASRRAARCAATPSGSRRYSASPPPCP